MLRQLQRLWVALGLSGTGLPAAAQTHISPTPTAPEGPLTLTDDDQKSLRDRVHELVWGGFDELQEVHETAQDYLNPRTWTQSDRDLITAEVDRQFSEKIAAETTWPKVTDWDRLDAAFTQIESRKIVALHNAGNTQSDAISDAGQIWHERGAETSGLRGYIFYHGQDVDRVVTNGQLHIGYGAFATDGNVGYALAIEVCAILSAAGFAVTTPPDAGTRILITGMDWKKRSPRP